MPRDTEVEQAFTTADDAMQGLWALHSFLTLTAHLADDQAIVSGLPRRVFRMTHHWERHYDPGELVRAIRDTGIEILLSRSSLVSLVAILEAALERMNARVVSKGADPPDKGHKKLLTWAFQVVKGTDAGSPQMLKRLPVTCGDLDNARRLRNCIVHNKGRYDERYWNPRELIRCDGVEVQNEADANSGKVVGRIIRLTTERFEYFTWSHIEFLHILHNTVQRKFFGHDGGYSYAEEKKRIEWHKVL